MAWLMGAMVGAAVAGVGFWRGTQTGLAAEGLPGAAAALFCLLLFRATSGRGFKAVRAAGGWPLTLAGALSLLAGLGALVDAVTWFFTRRSPMGHYGLPFAALGLGLMVVASLRLSTVSERKRQFYVLGLAALISAAFSVATLLNALKSN